MSRIFKTIFKGDKLNVPQTYDLCKQFFLQLETIKIKFREAPDSSSDLKMEMRVLLNRIRRRLHKYKHEDDIGAVFLYRDPIGDTWTPLTRSQDPEISALQQSIEVAEAKAESNQGSKVQLSVLIDQFVKKFYDHFIGSVPKELQVDLSKLYAMYADEYNWRMNNDKKYSEFFNSSPELIKLRGRLDSYRSLVTYLSGSAAPKLLPSKKGSTNTELIFTPVKVDLESKDKNTLFGKKFNEIWETKNIMIDPIQDSINAASSSVAMANKADLKFQLMNSITKAYDTDHNRSTKNIHTSVYYVIKFVVKYYQFVVLKLGTQEAQPSNE
jgi:hypothetical protein